MSSEGTITVSDQCIGCDHLQYRDGGHCYMFKTEPANCAKNTARRARFGTIGMVAGRGHMSALMLAALAGMHYDVAIFDDEPVRERSSPPKPEPRILTIPKPSRPWPRVRDLPRGKADRKAAKRARQAARGQP